MYHKILVIHLNFLFATASLASSLVSLFFYCSITESFSPGGTDSFYYPGGLIAIMVLVAMVALIYLKALIAIMAQIASVALIA